MANPAACARGRRVCDALPVGVLMLFFSSSGDVSSLDAFVTIPISN